MMRISELAERSGVPVSTLRYYETSGLLPAGRSGSGYRLYGDEAVGRLAFIGAGKRLGLSLKEIGAVLGVWESGACADVKADLRPLVAAHLADAERRAADLAAFIASLHAALTELDALPDRREPCGSACGYPRQGTAGSPEAARPRSVPIACSLSGADAAVRARAWHDLLAGADRTDLPGGIRVTLPAERIGPAAELAAAEARCCPFFDFRLHLVAGVLHLEIRAPEEAAGLLAGLAGPASRRGGITRVP